MRLSPQSKIFFLLALYISIGFILAVVVVETQLMVFVIAFFTWFIVINYLLFNVRCPSCGEQLVNQGKVKGLSFFASICSKKCLKCGYDLDKDEKDERP
jgi:DNA-directed RNA polymerase subunit RPC12/RpoP